MSGCRGWRVGSELKRQAEVEEREYEETQENYWSDSIFTIF